MKARVSRGESELSVLEGVREVLSPLRPFGVVCTDLLVFPVGGGEPLFDGASCVRLRIVIVL